jgi:hypothetical protein
MGVLGVYYNVKYNENETRISVLQAKSEKWPATAGPGAPDACPKTYALPCSKMATLWGLRGTEFVKSNTEYTDRPRHDVLAYCGYLLHLVSFK